MVVDDDKRSNWIRERKPAKNLFAQRGMMRTKIAHEENEHPSASVAVLSCLKEVIGCTAPNLRVAGEVGVPLKYVPRWFRLHRRVSRTKQTSWVVLPKGTFVPYYTRNGTHRKGWL